MRLLIFFKILLLVLSFGIVPRVFAADLPADTYFRASVETIISEGNQTVNGIVMPYQNVKVRFLDSPLKGTVMTIEHGKFYLVDKSKFVQTGETVVIDRILDANNTPVYQIVDSYRLPSLVPILSAFVICVVLLSGWRGIGSLLGMGVSLLVITQYIVPNILSGKDPLAISIIGSLFIMAITLYLAHGFSRQTTVSLFATGFSLLLTGLLSVLFVKIARLSGLGSEDAYSLKLGASAIVNFKGLLLGGILIGALGVLDDVTTGLSAATFELYHANPYQTFSELVSAGLRVGREHVASLVNTLVLAYAGASLPIFITLIVNPNRYPLWSSLNSEMIVEEIIRTLSGSFGLILAVPITTVTAAWILTKKSLPVAGSGR